MPRSNLIKDTDEDVVVEKKKKSFAQSDGVRCHSVIQGSLYMEGAKTGMLYSFTDYGDISEIEYRDLVAAVRSKSAYIFNPYIIVDDEDFIQEFPQLVKFYADQYSVKDLKDILSMSVSEMVETIKTLPPGAVESLKTIASTQVANGKLDSVKKIKALDELFGTDLNLIGELFANE